VGAIQDALAKLRAARSREAGDEYSDELARAARQHPDEILELIRTARTDTAALVWSLQGLTEAR